MNIGRNFIIYIVENDINDKVYIGQTYESIESRWERHTGYQLNNDDHFHRAIRKYGIEHFTPRLLDDTSTSQEELTDKEIVYILSYPKSKLYNTKFSKGKCGGDTLSQHPNKEEICKKIAESKYGGKNPHANKVVAIAEKEEIYFNSFSEAQIYFKNEKKFDLSRYTISRRCRGLVVNPIEINKEMWNFKYLK